jgi:hypothetical protein
MIPESLSAELEQNSGPVLAVHPDGQLMVSGWYGSNIPAGGTHAPLFVSKDGGWSWKANYVASATRFGDQSYSFSGSKLKLYGVVGGGSDHLVSVMATEDPRTTEPLKLISILSAGQTSADQPFILARTFDQDRIYVGQNYLGGELGGQTASVRVSTDGGATFRLWGLETRSTVGQDAPSVQPAVAKDGTLYVAFISWKSRSDSYGNFIGDIVVCRDDEGAKAASGSTPFRALRDQSDNKPGRIVMSGRTFPWGDEFGQQRIGSYLAIAVDPNRSTRVFLAWADQTDNIYAIHLRKSEDAGQSWSGDLRTIPSAVNPAVAIAEDGGVGFLYQQLVDASKTWDTHLETSYDGATFGSNLLLNTFPAESLRLQFQPYLADRGFIAAVGNDFYGVFAASNDPNPSRFPQGVRFQRRHRFGKLLGNDGVTAEAISIDPYFFHLKR